MARSVLRSIVTALWPNDRPGAKLASEAAKIKANFTDLDTQFDSGTATCSSNAATLSKRSGVITSESLTTAAGSGQDLTITCTECAATDILLVTRVGGTSTAGTPLIKAVPGDGSFVITVDNKHASAALNGTFKIAFFLIKAGGLRLL